MTGRNLFTYSPGHSPLHVLDPRCKFFLVSLISIGTVPAAPLPCLAVNLLMMALLNRLGISPMALVRQLKYFMVFLAVIILIRGMTEEAPPVFSLFGLDFSRAGFADGVTIALRFFLIMLLGIALSATTGSSEMKAAVQWFLAPVPLIPEHRVGVMISLALRFFPLILFQAHETGQAIRARCGNRQKNPIKRISRLTLSLLGKSFQAADGMALAMEARCYSETRTDPVLVPGGKEPLAVISGIGVFLFLIL